MCEQEKEAIKYSDYIIVKSGRFNKANEMLFIRPKKDKFDYRPSQGKLYRVIRCKDDGIQYIFSIPCPTCGEFHKHGSGFGHRLSHCFQECKCMMENVHGETYESSYYIASEEEYKKLWKYAKDLRRLHLQNRF